MHQTTAGPPAPEPPRRARRRRLLPFAVAAGLVAAGALPLAASSASGPDVVPGDQGGDVAHHVVQQGGVDRLDARSMRRLRAARLGEPADATSTRTVTAPTGGSADPIDMRVLVLATKGDPNPDGVHTVPAGSWDWDLSTLTNALEYTGVPYDTYKATTRQLCVGGTWTINWSAGDTTDTSCTTGTVVDWTGGVTADRLWDGALHAYYEGVMQTNGTLSYVDPSGGFVASGLSAGEWSALWTFEAQFGIRTVSANTYPTADFGLTYVGEDGNPTQARWSSAGAAAFPYVNAANPLPIANAWTYRAKVADTATTPLLTDPAGNVLAAVHTDAAQGNRQTLALTFDSASYLTHGTVLGYGLVNWVTKGLFLGERHAVLDPQPDDLFIADSIWQPTTPCGTAPDDPSLPEYRMTGGDLTRLALWQSAKQSNPISRALTIEYPFNGEGTVPGFTTGTDTLTPAVRQLQGLFKFVNHTYTHQNLDAVTYDQATAEIQQDNAVATQLRLSRFSRQNLIQPDISGLGNASFLQAAYDAGIRYLISDTSRTGDPAQYGPNEGRYNALVPGILEVARYPVNLYFNVRTPQQWLAEDNCLYPASAPFGHVSTYQQLLDRESTVITRYLLQGSNRPLMFHQPNTSAYGNGRSLLSDLLDATLTKYSALVKVPVTSPTMDQIGQMQAARTAYNRALRSGAITASIVPGTSVTLTAQVPVTVPVTGVRAPSPYRSELYAGQWISYIPLAAGQSVTIPLGTAGG